MISRQNEEKSVQTMLVIACDKREAFTQGSDSDEAIQASARTD
jgi:hypothetical protein